MATPQAFASVQQFHVLPDSATTFNVEFHCIVLDGVNPTWDFGGLFAYDSALTPADNLDAAKAAIADACLAGGYTVPTANVFVDIKLQ